MAKIQYIITEKEWKAFQEYNSDDLPHKVNMLSQAIGRYKKSQRDHQRQINGLNEIIDEQNLMITGYKTKLKEFEKDK